MSLHNDLNEVLSPFTSHSYEDFLQPTDPTNSSRILSSNSPILNQNTKKKISSFILTNKFQLPIAENDP